MGVRGLFAFGFAGLFGAIGCQSSQTNPPGLQDLGNGPPPPSGANSVASKDAGIVLGDGGSTVVSIASGIAAPTSIALGSVSAYWTDASGAVWSVSIGGGTPSPIATGQSAPVRIAVSSAGVLAWTNSGDGAQGGGSVVSFDPSSGSTTSLATNLVQPYGVAVSSADVYWSNVSLSQPGVEVDQAPVAGGPTLELGTTYGELTPGGLATDGANAYFASTLAGGGGSISDVPLAGGSLPDTLWETTAGAPSNVVYQTASLYWLVSSPPPQGAVWGVTLPTGKPTALATGLDSPQDLGSDGANVYFTLPSTGEVDAVPIGGGTPVVVASGLRNPGPIAVGDAALYVGTADGLVRIEK